MQYVVRQQVMKIFEPDARDPDRIEGDCWIEELSKTEKAVGEVFAARVRDH